ncbi:MAG: glycine dehydrogenase [Epsilonproteobacteria bacterium]|nr:MAG: glycine dehydrogenase [Campylobacterota bacterium]RLA63692.1 MAG: glycine dehydrogenase [Campylobacterota bacterium]
MAHNFSHLPYDPTKLQRELKKYYISATEDEIQEMLNSLSINNLEELFAHIPNEVMFEKAPNICKELDYESLISHLEQMAAKNKIKTSFIGDGLKNYRVPEIVPFVSDIRGLTTAYTPYQPERSQGTLATLWMYSSTLSMLTGFEAINSSLYDRATGMFEAIKTSIRLKRNTDTVLILKSNYPGDIEVVRTHAKETKVKIETIDVDPKTGITNISALKEKASSIENLAGIVFPQVNNLGNLEDVYAISSLCRDLGVKSIAIIDPMLLATGGLVPPSEYEADIIVGEGQHLAIGPNFGGPGLGIFGIRYNDKNKLDIRSTPGRYIGKAKDADGNDCLSMVLSTREQHIRREKATSNICSNQGFLSTLVGAAVLERGEKGMSDSCKAGKEMALKAAKALTGFEGVALAFNSAFFNEFTLEFKSPVSELIEKARKSDIHLGVDVSKRVEGNRNLLLLSFFDIHTDHDLDKLINFFADNFTPSKKNVTIADIPKNLKRLNPVGLPSFSLDELKKFYTELGEQNVSPDNSIYPLGSCTMKYNPYINDYAAGLSGFTDIHPQAPEGDAQGCLEIIYETQEIFKNLTGLSGVTTQPVAGAQGELVGIKMFQAYHRDRGENRDVILIPRTAHGTNPATATMAGFETKIVDGKKTGIITVEANDHGQIDLHKLKELIKEYGPRIAGIMVTNPNTSGILEKEFKAMADLIHKAGGLVYMDGANMNAIAGWIDLKKLGVDAVHNNTHKTWTIPHGGGGPGDAFVAVSKILLDYLPGIQVIKDGDNFKTVTPSKSIGTFHRHFGNFAHKVRCYAYLKALGSHGVRKMSAVAVLSARYLFENLKTIYPTLPIGAEDQTRMHEFIITIEPELFKRIEESGTPKTQAIARIGKLFLDFGLHAPTVAFPEIFGLMIEPTESFSKNELDRFNEVVSAIHKILFETPEVLTSVPHFTPIRKVDEVGANKNLILFEKITKLPKVLKNKIDPSELSQMNIGDICQKILKAHQETIS